MWNIRTNAQWSVQTLVGHSGTVRCLHLEGKRLVSGSTDKSIKVRHTPQLLSSLPLYLCGNVHLQFLLYITVILCEMSLLSRIGVRYEWCVMYTVVYFQVWDLSTQESWSSIACKVTMIGHTDTVRCLQVREREWERERLSWEWYATHTVTWERKRR